LESTGWNIVRTAAVLGVARNTVRARMDRFELRARRTPRAPVAAQPESQREEPSTALPPVAAPPPSASVRWDRRHVTLLRVAFGGADATAGDASHLVSVGAEKVAGFGGRIERLGSSVLDASFGVAPLENAARRAVSAAL